MNTVKFIKRPWRDILERKIVEMCQQRSTLKEDSAARESTDYAKSYLEAHRKKREIAINNIMATSIQASPTGVSNKSIFNQPRKQKKSHNNLISAGANSKLSVKPEKTESHHSLLLQKPQKDSDSGIPLSHIDSKKTINNFKRALTEITANQIDHSKEEYIDFNFLSLKRAQEPLLKAPKASLERAQNSSEAHLAHRKPYSHFLAHRRDEIFEEQNHLTVQIQASETNYQTEKMGKGIEQRVGKPSNPHKRGERDYPKSVSEEYFRVDKKTRPERKNKNLLIISDNKTEHGISAEYALKPFYKKVLQNAPNSGDLVVRNSLFLTSSKRGFSQSNAFDNLNSARSNQSVHSPQNSSVDVVFSSNSRLQPSFRIYKNRKGSFYV